MFLFTLEIIYGKGAFALNGLAVAFNGFLSGILALALLTPLELLLNTASVFRLDLRVGDGLAVVQPRYSDHSVDRKSVV